MKTIRRFYKYMIYRLYTWRLKEKDDTPIGTVEFLMCVPHYLQAFTVYVFLICLFPWINNFNLSKPEVFLIAIGFQILYHLLLFYKKERLLGYSEQFKDETHKQREKGTLLIQLYMASSIVLFFISLVILFFLHI